MGVGEGPFHVAEHLALKQSVGNGTRIDTHHRLGGAIGKSVYLVGQHILTCAVLARNQDRGIGRGHLLDLMAQSYHRLALAPTHHRSWCSRNLFSTYLTVFHASLFECGEQFGVVPGLHHEVEGPTFHAFHGEGDVGVGSEEHHLHLGKVAFQFR